VKISNRCTGKAAVALRKKLADKKTL
jgi:hypothetical protein